MDNLILYQEDIKMMSVTNESDKFLSDNSLKIADHICYEIVLKEPIEALGKNRKSLTLQGKPGGTLKRVKFCKINYGLTKDGNKVSPFGVVFFEEKEEEE